MSLLNPPAKPDKSRAMAFTIAALAVVAIVVQRVNELLGASASRAELTDYHAGCGVGEHRSIDERRPGCNGQRQNTENSVPCTCNVKDLAAGGSALDSRLPHARVGHFKTSRANV